MHIYVFDFQYIYACYWFPMLFDISGVNVLHNASLSIQYFWLCIYDNDDKSIPDKINLVKLSTCD
jgi:hypothetical protein